ncbi:MBL fold metallo-hydrolase [Speluncibacter jeojiensis]
MKSRTVAAAAGLVALGAVLAREAWRIPAHMGAGRAEIRPYAASSPHYRRGAFHNLEPSEAVAPGEQRSVMVEMLRRGRVGTPSGPVPVRRPDHPAQAGALAATWYGHATVLLEIDGLRVLTDPVFCDRVSPSALIGPRRLHPVPEPAAQLPELDLIVISHDHYDHLDKHAVRQLLATQRAPFAVPTGVSAHLRRWGVPAERIVECDWGESATVGELTVNCTPARHFSGRGLVRNTTQWCSWVIAGPRHRVFFAGDTGITGAFEEVGRDHGPFDLTLMPIGAYARQWPDIHLDPEEAVQMHTDLGKGDPAHAPLLAIHWGTFNLAMHSWAEPVQRLLWAADAAGTETVVPRPGQRVDLESSPSVEDWWSPLA